MIGKRKAFDAGLLEFQRRDALDAMPLYLSEIGISTGVKEDKVIERALETAEWALKDRCVGKKARNDPERLAQASFYVAMRIEHPDQANGRFADKISAQWEAFTSWSRLADDIWIRMNDKDMFGLRK